MPSQVRAFVFALLIAGLMLAAPRRATYAQSLDAVVARSVARVAQQTGQPARRFDLTLDAAVQRALERNLDIAVQRIQPLVQDMQIVAANAAFLPFALSGLILDQATTPNRFVFDGGGLAGQSIVTDLGVYDVVVGQQMKWGGGRYDVAWDSTRWESTNIFSTFNPSFGVNMTLQYTQPLLRGFRTDSRRTQLVVSRIACSGRRWRWPSNSWRTTRFRVEVGTMAPIDVVAAQSEAAARRQLLALAVETQRTSELVLKELIVGGTFDALWNAELNPTDQPRIEATPIDRPRRASSRSACRRTSSSCSRNAISPPRRMPSCARFSTTSGHGSSSSGRSALRLAAPASPWSGARRPAALRAPQAPHRRGGC